MKKEEDSHFEWLNQQLKERSKVGRIEMKSESMGVIRSISGDVIGTVEYFHPKQHGALYGYSAYDLNGDFLYSAHSIEGLKVHLVYKKKLSNQLGVSSIMKESQERTPERSRTRS